MRRSGDPREADRGAEVHERMRRARPERAFGSVENTAHVHIDRKHWAVEGKPGHGVGRVATYSGKLGQVVGPAVRRDSASGAVQVERAAVVAEPLPLADRVCGRRGGERLDRRPPLEPPEIPGNDARDLRLLEHDLRDEDRVRVAGLPPRQVSSKFVEPSEERLLHGADPTEAA